MKYYKTIEDPNLYDDVSPYKIAKELGESESYHYRIRSGQHTISEDKYNQILETKKKVLDRLDE